MTKIKNQEKQLNIYQRMNAVMAEASYIQKDHEAAGLRYKTVSHDKVTAKLRGPMQKHGIAMVSDILELTQDGNRTSVKMAFSFVNIDDPKDRLTVHFYGYGIDNQDKGPGKAISYCTKYCLLKTFCIESGTDDDIESHNIDHVPTNRNLMISVEQITTLEELINGHADIRSKVLAVCNNDIASITSDRYEGALKWIQALVKSKEESND